MPTQPDAPETAEVDPPVVRRDRAQEPGRWGLLPNRWRWRLAPSQGREIAFLTAGFITLAWIRSGLGSRAPADCGAAPELGALRRSACERALDIWHFERALGTGFELSVGKATGRAEPLAHLANHWYALAPVIATAAVLAWIYLRHPAQYRGLRTALVSATAVALLGYLLYPMAPPRMLTQAGFVDTGTAFPSWGYAALSSRSNQFAVMPALQIAWTAWAATAVVALSSKRWLRLVAVIVPVLTALASIATANHFWVNAVAGLVALWAGFLLQRLLSGQSAIDRTLSAAEPSATAP